VRNVELPAACAVFFAGLLASGAVFFQTRPFDGKAAVISDLESPEDNPHGYGFGAAGTAICALLLAPVGLDFYRRLRTIRPMLARAGGWLLGAGLAAATAIGFLAPFTRGYTPLHIQLAFGAFFGICAGTALLLAIAGGAARSVAAKAMAGLNGAVMAFLLYLYFGPDFFDNKTLLTSLAFCEWLLCIDCAVALWILAAAVNAIPRVAAARASQ
jgi:hypothetical protein